MICKHCKAENEDGALFCSNCGKPLEDEEYDREKMRGNTKLYIGTAKAKRSQKTLKKVLKTS